MSHVNVETQQRWVPIGRIPLKRVRVAETPNGPIADRRYGERGPDDTPMPRVRLCRPLASVTGSIPKADAFVLACIGQGLIAIDDLMDLCPFPPFAVLKILDRWAERGVVGLGE